jgi:hypothetical protein
MKVISLVIPTNNWTPKYGCDMSCQTWLTSLSCTAAPTPSVHRTSGMQEQHERIILAQLPVACHTLLWKAKLLTHRKSPHDVLWCHIIS